VSQSVPHLHVHIVPRRKKDGLKGFFWPRNEYGSPEEIVAVQKSIQAAVAGLQKSL
jgi:histidine triad (HIT) family protein